MIEHILRWPAARWLEDASERLVRLAPALPPAPLTFAPADTGTVPEAGALASRLASRLPGMDWHAFSDWAVGAGAPEPAASTLPAVPVGARVLVEFAQLVAAVAPAEAMDVSHWSLLDIRSQSADEMG